MQNGEFVPQLFVPPPLAPPTHQNAFYQGGYQRGQGRGRGRGRGRGFYEHPNRGKDSPDQAPRKKKLFPVRTESREKNEKYQRNFPQPRVGFKKPPQRKVPRNFSGKDPKSVVCCYCLLYTSPSPRD